MKAGFLNAVFMDLKTQIQFLHQKRQNCTEGETQAGCKTDENGANPYECFSTYQSYRLPAIPHHHSTFYALSDRHQSTAHRIPRSPSFWKIDLVLIFVTDGVDSLRMKKAPVLTGSRYRCPLRLETTLLWN